MASAALKSKAVFFILLLGGFEAVRISERVSRNKITSETPLPASAGQTWRDENGICSWNMKTLKCHGSGCSFRPLILDRSMSASCRLSLGYMLENASYVKEYVGLQADLLAEKSISFRKAAMSTSWFQKSKWRCLRAGGHMLQASEFLVAVKQRVATGELPIALVTEIEPKVAGAIKSLADSFGKDGDLILEFQTKLANRKVDASKNPERTARMMIDTVQKLFSTNESDREVARVSIKSMPSESQVGPSKEEIMEIERVENQIKRNFHMEEMDGLSRIEEALVDLTMKSRKDDHLESSLIERGGPRRPQRGGSKVKDKGDDAVLKVILMIIVLYFLAPVITVLLIFLLFMILAIIVGATGGTVGSGGSVAVASVAAIAAR